jgi:hypothetical protein
MPLCCDCRAYSLFYGKACAMADVALDGCIFQSVSIFGRMREPHHSTSEIPSFRNSPVESVWRPLSRFSRRTVLR